MPTCVNSRQSSYVFLLLALFVAIGASLSASYGDEPTRVVTEDGEASVASVSADRSAEPVAAEEVDWRERMIKERREAYDMLTSRRLVEGATVLLNTLRALPADQPELMDDAFGTVFMLLFAMEYLMNDECLGQFSKEQLEASPGEWERFITAAYDLGIGQEDPEGKMKTMRSLESLTHARIPQVRIGALFYLSDTYFIPNVKMAQERADRLAAEFPDLEVTRAAQRFQVFRKDQDSPGEVYAALQEAKDDLEIRSPRRGRKSKAAGPQVSEAELAVMAKTPRRAAGKQVVRNDPVLGTLDAAMPKLMEPALEARGVAELCDQATAAPEWRTRYGCLHVAQDYRKRGYESEIRRVCETLAARPGNTSDIVRARRLDLKFLRYDWGREGPTDASVKHALDRVAALLEVEWDHHVYERSLIEDVWNGIRHAGRDLARHGRLEDAKTVFAMLAAKYPGTLIEEECLSNIAILDGSRQKTVELPKGMH